jgi:hypothetical protein
MRAMRLRGLTIGLLCALGATRTTAATSKEVLPFIADDYTKAVAEARARKVPIFIESWAPW